MNEQQAIQEILANLRIENPCPMVLARMRGDVAGEYYCGSCEKQITDFRNCSKEEIVQKVTSEENICGIFHREQLAGQKYVQYNLWQKAAYTFLVILSFIGFNVKPLNAQTVQKDSSHCSSKDSIKTIKVGHNYPPIPGGIRFDAVKPLRNPKPQKDLPPTPPINKRKN